MEFVHKIVDIAKRASESNTVINVGLGAVFAILGARSYNQQKIIEALEVEKESLSKTNKSIRNTLWDWKQQLYAEAASDSAPVPLARLYEIYGEAAPPQQSAPGDPVRKDANPAGPAKIMI